MLVVLSFLCCFPHLALNPSLFMLVCFVIFCVFGGVFFWFGLCLFSFVLRIRQPIYPKRWFLFGLFFSVSLPFSLAYLSLFFSPISSFLPSFLVSFLFLLLSCNWACLSCLVSLLLFMK